MSNYIGVTRRIWRVRCRLHTLSPFCSPAFSAGPPGTVHTIAAYIIPSRLFFPPTTRIPNPRAVTIVKERARSLRVMKFFSIPFFDKLKLIQSIIRHWISRESIMCGEYIEALTLGKITTLILIWKKNSFNLHMYLYLFNQYFFSEWPSNKWFIRGNDSRFHYNRWLSRTRWFRLIERYEIHANPSNVRRLCAI